ncbi:hypothetical protein SOVF_172570 [Spinacia oleracea]|nr:hypothetical protein SOVF_172570 [Spinacia oleracea]
MSENVAVEHMEGQTMIVKYKDDTISEQEIEGEGEEEEEDWSSDSDIVEALDWLDMKDVDEGGVESGSITLNARRPNAHGGALSRSRSSTLQPLSNRSQKITHHIRASPLEVIISYIH